jgi:hypothetical protein
MTPLVKQKLTNLAMTTLVLALILGWIGGMLGVVLTGDSRYLTLAIVCFVILYAGG